MDNGRDDGGFNYRKIAAISALTLLLTGVATSWSVIQPSSDGTSDVDADTVDGYHASQLGGLQNLSEVLAEGNSVGNYNLDMNSQSITNIGGLQNCNADQFVAGDGSCTLDSFAADTDNQNLQDVLAQGNSVGDWNINLNGNAINTGGGTVIVNDSTNNQDIARFKEGGNVQVPNGNINMSNNNVTYVNCLGDEC